MKFNKKKAFTLIEMLVVVVIIGIILVIAIPSVSKLLNNRNRQLYDTHIKLLEKEVGLYIDQYRGELNNKSDSCYNINYKTLVSEGFQETDIKCKGNIILTKANSDYDKNYFLTCTSTDGEVVIDENKNIPGGCIGFNGKFKMNYKVYSDSNKTTTYDGTSYVKNAYVEFSSTSPYAAAISHYEYSISLNGNWKTISNGSNLGTIDDIKNHNGTLYVRSVDKDGNTSTSVRIPLKMDNTGPTFSTSVAGTYVEKSISISNVSDKAIGKVPEFAYSFDGGNTWVNSMSYQFKQNKTVNVCVKDILENKTCKDVEITGIDDVVPDKPSVAISDNISSGNWHKENFTLTLSGANNISGNTYYYGTTNNPTTKGTTISINTDTKSEIYYMKVCSGAGYCSELESYEVKLDKVTPSAPTITASDNIASGQLHTDNFILTLSGADNISENTYYYGTTTSPSTKGDSISITTNTTSQIYYAKVCSGAGLCSTANNSYEVKLDNVTPTIIAKNSTNYITTSTNSAITSYFNITFGNTSGSTVCKLGTTTVTNTNELSLGVNTVTCTATGNNGKLNSASITFRHQYNATYACSGGRTLSGDNCTYYYTSNQSKCGCSIWNSCATSACGTTNYSCATSACGVASYNTCANSACGKSSCASWGSWSNYSCRGSSSACSGTNTIDYQYQCSTSVSGCSYMLQRRSCSSYNYKSCATSGCGVASYNTCQNSACGSYNNTCANSACGCKTASSCTVTENEYRYYQCVTTGNNGTTGTLNGSTCSF